MVFISLTRLRIRSIFFLPGFAINTFRSLAQLKKAFGFRDGALLNDRKWTFWTLTAWDTRESMLQFMTTGAHKKAMPRLLDWCDEASVAHWEQPEAALPSWLEADHKMRTIGRPSKVRHPSPQHGALNYAAPKTGGSQSIKKG